MLYNFSRAVFNNNFCSILLTRLNFLSGLHLQWSVVMDSYSAFHLLSQSREVSSWGTVTWNHLWDPSYTNKSIQISCDLVFRRSSVFIIFYFFIILLQNLSNISKAQSFLPVDSSEIGRTFCWALDFIFQSAGNN